MNTETLGKAIRGVRKENGISLTVFSHLAPLSRAQLGRIELDQAPTPDWITLCQIMEALQCTPAQRRRILHGYANSFWMTKGIFIPEMSADDARRLLQLL